ncbi:MAG: PTS sugar transporter subunit IIA [Verrucomicrobia bacterium]|nr:PTS sugar transporter subunit IIA [Kiritimatiellia bacterium]MCP5487505.1 PTS sugar transporter subunit IIA [Verrucomicrobiota bacterium]
MPHTLFSTKEVADYLHLSEEDIELLVRRREIPFQAMGDRIMFRRADVDQWASQRLLGMTDKRLADFHRRTSEKLHSLSKDHAIISELMHPASFEPALRCRTKSSVMRSMVDLADATGKLYMKEDLQESLEAREKLCSTALAGGIALLHPQNHVPYMFEDSFLVAGRSIQPIPFGAPDGLTTDIFFLICCQNDRLHLHVLARLCMICYHTPLLLELREAEEDADALYQLVCEREQDVIRSLA